MSDTDSNMAHRDRLAAELHALEQRQKIGGGVPGNDGRIRDLKERLYWATRVIEAERQRNA